MPIFRDGEEEQLDKAFRKMSHARQMMESIASAHGMTGDEGASSAGDLVEEHSESCHRWKNMMRPSAV